jgi:alpha-L-rhamnosidase
VIHSNFSVYDNFSSDHSKLNKLSENVAWGLRGNFLDVPTDCPQRDERQGWTGDAQVFVSTSMYKADVYAFWAAWLESVREDQGIDGMIPKFVPFRQFLTDGASAAWGDAATIVPWELYQYTGDSQILAENYNMMKRWLLFTEKQSVDHISNMGTYGDWLQPYATNGRAKGDTHPDLIATAYYARSVDITAKAARILGYDRDAEQYERLFNNIKHKFRDYFFDEQLNLVTEAVKTIRRDNGKRLKKPKTSKITLKTTQTSYLLPLSFNLFTPAEETLAVEHLLGLLKESDHHLRTGFLGTPMLPQILQRFGHSDVMYDILLKETYPSWFYSINNGATTTWERWNSYSLKDGYNKANMNSLNHYAYGAVAQWFYNGMLGIQATTPGFKTFKVEPQFTHKLNNLTGSVPTINGDISVSWSITNKQLTMTLVVPKNTTASLLLPTISNLELKKNGNSLPVNSRLMPGEYKISGLVALNSK